VSAGAGYGALIRPLMHPRSVEVGSVSVWTVAGVATPRPAPTAAPWQPTLSMDCPAQNSSVVVEPPRACDGNERRMQETIAPERQNAEDVTSALEDDATAGGMNGLAATVRMLQGRERTLAAYWSFRRRLGPHTGRWPDASTQYDPDLRAGVAA
jgi:hypothetical protein